MVVIKPDPFSVKALFFLQASLTVGAGAILAVFEQIDFAVCEVWSVELGKLSVLIEYKEAVLPKVPTVASSFTFTLKAITPEPFVTSNVQVTFPCANAQAGVPSDFLVLSMKVNLSSKVSAIVAEAIP